MYRWSQSEFLRAWEAGAFDHRVELIDGEAWPVVIGSWTGKTVGRVVAALPRADIEVITATLPSGESLPDPDCWVQRAGAKPVAMLGTKIAVWNPADVLLVVEVSDDTVVQDLHTGMRLYGRTGYPTYWVVTNEAIHEHTEPSRDGYRSRREYRAGERIPVRYPGNDLAVDDLIAPAQSWSGPAQP